MLLVLAAIAGVQVVALRYFGVYTTEFGPEHPRRVLQILVNTLLHSDVLTLNEDGKQSRDWVNVEDCADAHFAASRRERFVMPLMTIANIASGKEWSILEVSEMLRAFLRVTTRIETNGTSRSGDARRCACVPEAAEILIGWKAKHQLEDDLREYCYRIRPV
jgi:nucleoside-diphosphate-sugar epimerase